MKKQSLLRIYIYPNTSFIWFPLIFSPSLFDILDPTTTTTTAATTTASMLIYLKVPLTYNVL